MDLQKLGDFPRLALEVANRKKVLTDLDRVTIRVCSRTGKDEKRSDWNGVTTGVAQTILNFGCSREISIGKKAVSIATKTASAMRKHFFLVSSRGSYVSKQRSFQIQKKCK